MKLRIDEVAANQQLNLSQVQRKTGLTMTKLRRYWYNETKSVELEALETLLKFFRQRDPSLSLADLFSVTVSE